MGADGQRCSSVAQLFSCTLLLVSISPSLPLISTAPRFKQMGLPSHGEARRALLRPRTGSNNWKWRHGGQRSLLCTGNQVGTSAASSFQTFRPPGLRVLAHREDILQAHAIVLLPEHMSHHVVKVRKAKVGHGLRVFNPRCGEWYAVVTSADPCSVELRIEWIIRSPNRLLAAKELVENATPATSLLFAPPKNTARLRFLVEKATELGAGTLQPVECAKGAAQAANVISHPLSQWAGEAAVQSERVSVPAVRATLPLVEAGLQACTEGRLLLICVEPRWAEGSDSMLSTLVAETQRVLPPGESPRGLALAVGPEGGFEEAEVRALERIGGQCVSIGGGVLRSETAGIAALSLCLAVSEARS